MMLKHPSGAKVRCTAHKRWALAILTAPPHGEDGPGTLSVVFRTNDRDALMARIGRERRRLGYGQTVEVFRLRDGSHVGTGGRMPVGTASL